MSNALNRSVSTVAPRTVQAYAYSEPSGTPDAAQSKVMSSDPSYAEYGLPAQTSANAPLFSTVTVTSTVAASAFSADTVNKYSYVSSASTSAGTANVGEAMSAALKRSVSAVAPRTVQVYSYTEPSGAPGAPDAEQSSAMSSDPS